MRTMKVSMGLVAALAAAALMAVPGQTARAQGPQARQIVWTGQEFIPGGPPRNVTIVVVPTTRQVTMIDSRGGRHPGTASDRMTPDGIEITFDIPSIRERWVGHYLPDTGGLEGDVHYDGRSWRFKLTLTSR